MRNCNLTMHSCKKLQKRQLIVSFDERSSRTVEVINKKKELNDLLNLWGKNGEGLDY